METGPPLVWIDAFADRPFGGNPAAVCVAPGERTDAWRAGLARELGLSETAFLEPRPDGAWDLRWFTPVREVGLCGHATLAAAHALWTSGRLAVDEAARFHTRSGLLTASREGDWIALDFPAQPVAPRPVPEGLLDALGAAGVYHGASPQGDHLVELPDEGAVRSLAPRFARLAEVEARGAIVTAPAADADHDFVSRFFAPRYGIDEDPVTGSAHCTLAPFWAGRTGKDELVGRQASARGGVVRVRPTGDRVTLLGRARTVMEGTLRE